MEILDRIDELGQLIETARSVPLSAACVVPRNDALDLLDDVRAALPGSVKEADEILVERDEMLDGARREAEKLVSEANVEANDTLADARSAADQVVSDANREAADIVDEARTEAELLLERAREESHRLVDEQEVMHLARAEAAELVEQGRYQAKELLAQAQATADELVEVTATETSTERRETDEFVDGKLADLEESLAASLAAVRRGRDKIHARRAAYKPVDVRDQTHGDLDLYDQIIEPR